MPHTIFLLIVTVPKSSQHHKFLAVVADVNVGQLRRPLDVVAELGHGPDVGPLPVQSLDAELVELDFLLELPLQQLPDFVRNFLLVRVLVGVRQVFVGLVLLVHVTRVPVKLRNHGFDRVKAPVLQVRIRQNCFACVI